MNTIATWRENQTTGLVDQSEDRFLRWRIEDNVRQCHCMPCRMTGKIDAQGMPYETARAIGPGGVARRKAEWRLAVPAPYDDAVGILLDLFHKVATPDVHAQFQRALLDQPFGRRLWQEQRERKARVQRREVDQRIQPSPKEPGARTTL